MSAMNRRQGDMHGKKIQSFLGHHAEAVIHILIWAFIVFVIWSIYWGGNALGSSWEGMETGRKLMILVSFPMVLTLNAFWLIPAYLKKRRWLRYGMSLLLVVALLELTRVALNAVFQYRSNGGFDFTAELLKALVHRENLFNPIFLGLLVSFGYRFTRDWVVNLGVIEKLKAEKASMELAFLKSQVDPHFLFNTLNTLYALALEEKGANTAAGIAKLGTLMRYSLHDSQQDFILLGKEIDYIRKYIELQRLRAGNLSQIEVGVQITEDQLAGEEIAPMLLLPFIENSFKYGMSPAACTSIHIDIALTESRLTLQVRNNIVAHDRAGQNGGVGLRNVKNRLRLLYPNKHQLRIQNSEGVFGVELTVDLSK